jgi:hypothetical protein
MRSMSIYLFSSSSLLIKKDLERQSVAMKGEGRIHHGNLPVLKREEEEERGGKFNEM